MKILLSLFFIFICHSSYGFGKSAHISPDSVVDSPIAEGDSTAIIMDCDGRPNVGFAYCRVQEGDSTGKNLTFVVPPAKCAREHCVYLEVWTQGHLVWSSASLKDETSMTVSWRELTGRAEFIIGDRGNWTVNEVVYWTDSDGNERQSRAQGDIVLRVFKKNYTPLHNSSEDPNYAWVFSDGRFQYKITSSLRSTVVK